jgi:hypothetical protein
MQRSQKRSTEDTHSDVEFICMTKIPKKSVKKTVKYLQPGHAPALLENLKLEDTAQACLPPPHSFLLFTKYIIIPLFWK